MKKSSVKVKTFVFMMMVLFTHLLAQKPSKLFHYGNLFQVATFHIGTGIDFNVPNGGDMGLILGGSTGWNYLFLSDVDIGLRFKYLYTGTDVATHSVGVIMYAHSWNMPNNGLFSFALGGGMLVASHNLQYDIGGYIELGTAFLKSFFPINGDLLYRASFYPQENPFGMDEMVHSIQIVFGFF